MFKLIVAQRAKVARRQSEPTENGASRGHQPVEDTVFCALNERNIVSFEVITAGMVHGVFFWTVSHVVL